MKVFKFAILLPTHCMKIWIYKFGTLLTSRPLGREALLAFRPTLKEVGPEEKLLIDFKGVNVLSPGWADEFITPLFEEYGERVVLQNTENPSVKVTLTFLEKIRNKEELF